MLKNYILIAVRNLLRNKTISFINIFGLSVSMSVCLLLILIVADQYAYDEFHEKEDKIHRVITKRVQEKQYEWKTATAPFLMGDIVKEHTTVDQVTTVNNKFSGVAIWNEKEIPFKGLYADNNFLKIFTFPLAIGNASTALKEPNSIVLKKDMAKKIFGDVDPINQVIEIEGLGDMVVTGVMDELLGKTHLEFEALGSIEFYTQLNEADTANDGFYKDWFNTYDSYTYFTSKDDFSSKELESHINKATNQHYEEISNYDYNFIVQDLDGITPGPLLSNTTGFSLPMIAVYFMLGIAAIVLLAAAFNYANLSTARAMNRAKEIGVRKVVGARKSHIFGQFMIESVIISIIAFIFADLIVQFILPRMNSYFASLGAPMSFNETPLLYVWFFGFVLLAGMLAGLVPSLFFASTNPLMALKKSVKIEQLGKRLGFAKLNVRKVLLVVQFTFSTVFIITMLAFYQQLKFVMNTDHGFKTEKLVTIDLQGVPYESLNHKFNQLASVSNVASTTHMPALGSNFTSSIQVNNENLGYISTMTIGGNYIDLMGINLIAGKNFPENMPKDERYIIINQSAVKKYGFESPGDALGQVLNLDGTELEVLGVVNDFHYERLDNEIGPFGFRYDLEKANVLVLKTNNQNTKAMLAEFELVWKDVTNRPFNFNFYEDELKISYAHWEALLIVTGYVTIIVVSIACLGFLGMVIYHIQNRTKEIGVRKTLGAGATDILKVVGKQFTIILLISFILGSPIAWFINNLWLEMNTYRFDFGWLTIATGLVLLVAVLIITVGSQLYKALKINPVDSLRNE